MDRNLAKLTNILIIDDQVLAQGYMKYALQELGFEKITYIDQAEKAINKIEHEDYDLIICSYHLKKEQEGYQLYQTLINDRLLSSATAFVFISADTSADIVHSIIELQPDEFLVKPFTVNEIGKRLSKVIKLKKVFREVYQLMDKELYDMALDSIEIFLTTPDKSDYFPIALKLKGDLLLACDQTKKARDFYQAIINVQNFAWAQFGLANALIALSNDTEAEKLLLRLAFKADAQIKAFDLLAEIQIRQKDFDMALESTMLASEISPRNINRHKTAVTLSRITHDYANQFEISKKIVRYAKNSVYDQPDIYLNVARAGIDYAMTASDAETNNLIKQSNEYLRRFRKQFPKVQLTEQLLVINARMHFLQDEKDKAQALLEQIDELSLIEDSMEDLLDKAKAFHEIGLFEKSMSVLNEIENRCKTQPAQGQIFMHYIQQEIQERQAIHHSPKDLNNNAVEYYQKGDLLNAMKIFRQAYRIMPKNPAIALNLLQAIAIQSKQREISDNAKAIMNRCIYTIENNNLTEEQEERYQKVSRFFAELV